LLSKIIICVSLWQKIKAKHSETSKTKNLQSKTKKENQMFPFATNRSKKFKEKHRETKNLLSETS